VEPSQRRASNVTSTLGNIQGAAGAPTHQVTLAEQGLTVPDSALWQNSVGAADAQAPAHACDGPFLPPRAAPTQASSTQGLHSQAPAPWYHSALALSPREYAHPIETRARSEYVSGGSAPVPASWSHPADAFASLCTVSNPDEAPFHRAACPNARSQAGRGPRRPIDSSRSLDLYPVCVNRGIKTLPTSHGHLPLPQSSQPILVHLAGGAISNEEPHHRAAEQGRSVSKEVRKGARSMRTSRTTMNTSSTQLTLNSAPPSSADRKVSRRFTAREPSRGLKRASNCHRQERTRAKRASATIQGSEGKDHDRDDGDIEEADTSSIVTPTVGCFGAGSEVHNIIIRSVGPFRGILPFEPTPTLMVTAWTKDVSEAAPAERCEDKDGIRTRAVTKWDLLHAVRRREAVAVVEAIVSRRPSLVRVRDKDGWLPIHHAASLGEFKSAHFLLEQWPGSVKEMNKNGSLPVHIALAKSTPAWPVVRLLVKLWSESLQVKNSKGFLPLHLAAAQKSPHLKGVQFLVDMGRKALQVASKDGSLPLHLAIIYHDPSYTDDKSWDVVTYLAKKTPVDALHVQNANHASPLHLALLHKFESWSLIKFLVTHSPQSVRAMNAYGSVALHLAALWPMDRLHVARLLVKQWPGALQVSNAKGLLPLHVAAAQGYPSIHFLQFLVDKYPTALHEKDVNGFLPLHLAVSQCVPCIKVTRLFVKQWSGSVRLKCNDGALPIHLAICRMYKRNGWKYKPLEIAKLLVETWVESLQVPNRSGSLPVHLALSEDIPCSSLVQYLVESGGAAPLLTPDATGSLPLHVAVAHRHANPTLVSSLGEAAPGALRVPDALGSLPLHVALSHVKPSSRIVKRLARQFPDALQHANNDGLCPAMVAASNRGVSLNTVYYLVRKWPNFIRSR
jgi:ankyrin repeat protein